MSGGNTPDTGANRPSQPQSQEGRKLHEQLHPWMEEATHTYLTTSQIEEKLKRATSAAHALGGKVVNALFHKEGVPPSEMVLNQLYDVHMQLLHHYLDQYEKSHECNAGVLLEAARSEQSIRKLEALMKTGTPSAASLLPFERTVRETNAWFQEQLPPASLSRGEAKERTAAANAELERAVREAVGEIGKTKVRLYEMRLRLLDEYAREGSQEILRDLRSCERRIQRFDELLRERSPELSAFVGKVEAFVHEHAQRQLMGATIDYRQASQRAQEVSFSAKPQHSADVRVLTTRPARNLLAPENPNIVEPASYATTLYSSDPGRYGSVEAFRHIAGSMGGSFWSGTDDSLRRRGVLDDAARAVNLRLLKLGTVLGHSSEERDSGTYRSAHERFTTEGSSFVSLIGGFSEESSQEMLNGELAGEYAQRLIALHDLQWGMEWLRDLNRKSISAGRNAKAIAARQQLFAACRVALEPKLNEFRQEAQRDPQKMEQYYEHCRMLALWFRGWATETGERSTSLLASNPLHETLRDYSDTAFASEMAMRAMNFDELAMRYMEHALEKEHPLKRKIEEKKPKVLVMLATARDLLGGPQMEELSKRPEFRAMIDTATGNPTDMQGIAQQYAALCQIEALFSPTGAAATPEQVAQEIQKELLPYLKEAKQAFENFLNSGAKGRGIEDINRAIGDPPLNPRQCQNYELLAQMRGYGTLRISDETWEAIVQWTKMTISIGVGIGVGIATGGMGLLGAAVIGSLTGVGTNFLLEGRTYGSAREMGGEIGTDIGIGMATMGIGRGLRALRYAALLRQPGQSAGKVFLQALEKEGVKQFAAQEHLLLKGFSRFMTTTTEGAANAALGAGLDSVIRGTDFVHGLQMNAIFFGVHLGTEYRQQILGKVFRRLPTLPEQRLREFEALNLRCAQEVEKFQGTCRECGVDPQKVIASADSQNLPRDPAAKQKVLQAREQAMTVFEAWRQQLRVVEANQPPQARRPVEHSPEWTARRERFRAQQREIMALPETQQGRDKRLTMAEDLLRSEGLLPEGVSLSETQRKAILCAHDLQPSVLREKLAILQTALSPEQSDALLRAGVAGRLNWTVGETVKLDRAMTSTNGKSIPPGTYTLAVDDFGVVSLERSVGGRASFPVHLNDLPAKAAPPASSPTSAPSRKTPTQPSTLKPEAAPVAPGSHGWQHNDIIELQAPLTTLRGVPAAPGTYRLVSNKGKWYVVRTGTKELIPINPEALPAKKTSVPAMRKPTTREPVAPSQVAEGAQRTQRALESFDLLGEVSSSSFSDVRSKLASCHHRALWQNEAAYNQRVAELDRAYRARFPGEKPLEFKSYDDYVRYIKQTLDEFVPSSHATGRKVRSNGYNLFYGGELPESGGLKVFYINPRYERYADVARALDAALMRENASVKFNLDDVGRNVPNKVVVYFAQNDYAGVDRFLKSIVAHPDFQISMEPGSLTEDLIKFKIPLAPGITYVERPGEASWDGGVYANLYGTRDSGIGGIPYSRWIHAKNQPTPREVADFYRKIQSTSTQNPSMPALLKNAPPAAAPRQPRDPATIPTYAANERAANLRAATMPMEAPPLPGVKTLGERWDLARTILENSLGSDFSAFRYEQSRQLSQAKETIGDKKFPLPTDPRIMSPEMQRYINGTPELSALNATLARLGSEQKARFWNALLCSR